MRNELAIRTGETALDRAHRWQNPQERKREAARALRDRDHETLGDLFRAYVADARGEEPSRHTVAAYLRGMGDLLDWCERGEAEGRLAHQLTREDAKAFRLWLTQAGGRPRPGEPVGTRHPLKPASTNLRLAAARQFCEALLWAGLADANPFGKLRNVRDPQDPASKRDPFAPDELDALLAVADRRERVVLLLAADGGLRLAEAAGLTWADVDLARGRMWVFGKGAKRQWVALSDRLAQALSGIGPLPPEARVLNVSRRRVQAILQALCRRAHVTPRGYHALRHSAACGLYRRTHDLGVVQRHLRHAHLDTTRIYAALDDDRYSEAVTALGEARTPAAA